MSAVIPESAQYHQLRRRNARLAAAVGALAIAFYVAMFVIYFLASH